MRFSSLALYCTFGGVLSQNGTDLAQKRGLQAETSEFVASMPGFFEFGQLPQGTTACDTSPRHRTPESDDLRPNHDTPVHTPSGVAPPQLQADNPPRAKIRGKVGRRVFVEIQHADLRLATVSCPRLAFKASAA